MDTAKEVWEKLKRETGWCTPDVHYVDSRGQTALRKALRCNNLSLIEHLLQWGADPNQSHPNAPLLWEEALVFAPQALLPLLQYGADPFSRNARHHNLFDAAMACSPQIVGVLLEKNIGVFELRRRYYDPHWDDRIPQSVKNVIQNHIHLQRAQSKTGTGQPNAKHKTASKSSSLG